MNVQRLIDLLEKVDDKEREVMIDYTVIVGGKMIKTEVEAEQVSVSLQKSTLTIS